MKTTASNLIRWAGLAAMGAGILFVVIQALHPLDVLESVTTTRWAIVHYLGIVMCLLGLLGMTGIYARQAEESGWLGLAGYLLFGLFFALSLAFQFVEAFISPLLASAAPQFVTGLLEVAGGHAGEAHLGALPLIYSLTGFAGYVLGGVLLGIATLRARVLPRWAGGLLIIAALLPLASALPVVSAFFPHPLDRIFAVPMGLAWIGLGYAVWSQRGRQLPQHAPGAASSPLLQAKAR